MDNVELLIRLAWTGVHRMLARQPGALMERLARRGRPRRARAPVLLRRLGLTPPTAHERQPRFAAR